MNNPNIDLNTKEGCEILWKTLKRNLVRNDFPEGNAGWKMFVDHKIRKHTRFANEEMQIAESWKNIRESEHLLLAMKKIKQLNKINAKKNELEKEIQGMNETE